MDRCMASAVPPIVRFPTRLPSAGWNRNKRLDVKWLAVRAWG